MRIDDRVEPLVRETLHAVVKRDGTRLNAALKAFPDQAARLAGLELAVSVTGHVIVEMYDGRPSADEIAALAVAVAEMEQWADIDAEEVATFLTAVVDARPMDGVLPADDAVMLTFIVTASLLASRSTAEDGKRWFNYLDRVEAAIEA